MKKSLAEIGTKKDYEEEFGTKPLGEFVREIVGLDMNAQKQLFRISDKIQVLTAGKFILSTDCGIHRS